ncbi:hypothetical protein AMK16_28105 [Streptomyces sp. CB00455]|nr:hypothetical protein AMK16_28105 [Streptomyces sp. CB00455]
MGHEIPADRDDIVVAPLASAAQNKAFCAAALSVGLMRPAVGHGAVSRGAKGQVVGLGMVGCGMQRWMAGA